MKHFYQFLLLSLFCLASNSSFAQEGLKFSKTFIIEVPKDGYAFTVPDGKIWRIEAAGSGGAVDAIWIENVAGESMFAIAQRPNIATAPSVSSHFNLASNFIGKFTLLGLGKNIKGFVSITEYIITP